VQYNKEVREILRKRGEPVPFDLTITERKNDCRITLPKLCHEPYEEVPNKVQAWYDPDEHALILDLPDRGNTTIDEF
jgi:hypothetical protein